MIRAGDAVVVLACAALVAASAVAFAPRGGTPRAALLETADGARLELPLDAPARVTRNGRRGPFTVEVADGRARFLDSDCAQKLCVRAGWLTRTGETAACAPNGAALTLVGGDPEFDAVTF